MFVESCYLRGTLERVLKDSGFAPDPDPKPIRAAHIVKVSLPLTA